MCRHSSHLIHDAAGFLFHVYPTLMTLETSATIMDAIFTPPEEEAWTGTSIDVPNLQPHVRV